MAKAREPKVFRSMDDLPLMLTPYDLMDFLGKGQRQTYELIHSEGFPYVQDGPKITVACSTCMATPRVLIPMTTLASAPLTFFCKSVVAAIADTAN